jgi:hypothetical protein
VAAGTDAAAVAPPLEAALTIPNVPAPITMVAMPAARILVELREEVSLRESIGRAPLFDELQRRAATWGSPVWKLSGC